MSPSVSGGTMRPPMTAELSSSDRPGKFRLGWAVAAAPGIGWASVWRSGSGALDVVGRPRSGGTWSGTSTRNPWGKRGGTLTSRMGWETSWATAWPN